MYRLLAVRIRRNLQLCRVDTKKLQEIRLRVNRPVLIRYDGKEYVLTGRGSLSDSVENAYTASEEDMKETLACVSGYSLYAFEQELRNGFITVSGGHRVGIAGRTVMDGDAVQCIRPISFINIRLAHQIIGCSDDLIPYLTDGADVYNTLIISPPGCGKTTILRDLIRQISDGMKSLPGKTVGLIDERSEIAGCYNGIPQNDVGIRTDVLDCCKKSAGMTMLLRSMAPQVMAVDEIGSPEDESALKGVFRCGCRIFATVHGNSLDDIRNKPFFRKLIEERMFERFVVLKDNRQGREMEVFDSYGSLLFQKKEPDGKEG